MKTVKKFCKVVTGFVNWMCEDNFGEFALVWETSAVVFAILAYGCGHAFSVWESVGLFVFPLLARICLSVMFFLLALGMEVAECFQRRPANKK